MSLKCLETQLACLTVLTLWIRRWPTRRKNTL